MSTQFDLDFELNTLPLLATGEARRTDPITSILAANSNLDGKSRDIVRALLALADAGERGYTDFELAVVTNSTQISIGKRRHNLTGKVKGEQVYPPYVEDSGDKRPSPTNSPSIVWKCTERGYKFARLIRERMNN
jgi:hypothetical protein